MHGIVIGGGIGGLALATALGRVGISCEVHEQAGELREIGAGLGLWRNALIALRRLGVAEAVMAAGTPVERFEIRTPDGRVLAVTRMPPPDEVERLPGNVAVLRPDLARVLESSVDGRRLHLGSRCVTVYADSRSVSARFADGREARGDFLVGADGLRSVVRAQLLGESPLRYAGYTCWRGIAKLERGGDSPATAFETWGRGRRFSVHPCGAGRVFWWATFNQPPNVDASLAARRATVEALFSGWHEPIPAVIAATPEILQHDLFDRLPVREWGLGCATLLGDAAHPTTPNLGQGACQALEDAVVLADQLSRSNDVPTALRGYERLRQRRTARVTVDSFRLGRICQWENSLACWLRNTATRLVPSSASGHFLERLFESDLPQLRPFTGPTD